MIEQLSNSIRFLAYFSGTKVGVAGLTVTVDVRSPAGVLIVTGGAATEVGGGLYSYTLAAGSVTTEGEYTAIFKTANATVDLQHVPSLWTVGRAGVENLDASINSRSSHTANQAADALLDRADGVEVDMTLRQALRLVTASAGGKLTGAATTTVTVRNTADSKTRITATVTPDGDRTAVTYDLT